MEFVVDVGYEGTVINLREYSCLYAICSTNKIQTTLFRSRDFKWGTGKRCRKTFSQIAKVEFNKSRVSEIRDKRTELNVI